MIESGSLIFAASDTKLKILKQFSEQSLFLNIKFYNGLGNFGSVTNQYYFHMIKTYDFSYDLAKKLLMYLDYINIDENYTQPRLAELAKIKQDLISNNIFLPFDFSKSKSLIKYVVDDMPVPSMFDSKLIKLDIHHKAKNPIKLIVTENAYQSCLAVYEKTVELLELGIAPDDIAIINANPTDIYQLRKIFSDAGIPLNPRYAEPLNKYPLIIKLIKVLTQEGYYKFKDELSKAPEDEIKKTLIKIINNFFDADLHNYPEVLVSVLEQTMIPARIYAGAIKAIDLKQVATTKSLFYLVMNYTDLDLVKYKTYYDYLTKNEIEIIGYPSIDEINIHLESKTRNLLESLDNLVLFHPEISEQENRIANVGVNREMFQERYNYITKESSYLKTLNILEYSKAKYAKEKFSLNRNDFSLLENSYQKFVFDYSHNFTGINRYNLDDLLKKNNTLTGAKIESYNLCRFQFLLKYLLKFRDTEESTYQFLGTLTHKVLEEVTKNKDLDWNEIVSVHLDFPSDLAYKESVYRTALTKELEKLVPLFLDFHNNTQFNTIHTEVKFKIPYGDFFLTGTIDKVMIMKTSSNGNYFVLVDYKLNDKDFSMEKFEAGRMLQIPVYLYAFIKMNDQSMKPAGLFYQKTGVGRYKLDSDALEVGLRYKGIALKNTSVMTKFDGDLSHIHSISLKQDGDFAKSERLLTDKEFQEILLKVESQINNAINKIKEGDFSINPLPSHGQHKDSVSCEYCDYSNICYNKNKGLGGDEE